jgi:phosphohistidine swiveling domain-containing protein
MVGLPVDSQALQGGPPWPGWAPGPQLPGLDPTRPMAPADLRSAWRLDFHHPRGIVPLALRLLDHLVAGSQAAAAEVGAGPGFTARLVGTHVYYGAARPTGGSGRDDSSGTAGTAGAAAVVATPDGAGWASDPQALQAYAEAFPRQWAGEAARLDGLLRELEAVGQGELEDLGAPAIAGYLERSLRVHADAWRVHFATMYRLLAVHEHLLARLRELGLNEVTVAGLLQGEDNAVLDADVALRELVRSARDLGLTSLFEGLAQKAPADLVARLTAALPTSPTSPTSPSSQGPPAAEAVWWRAFTDFLERHGHRGEAGAELLAAPWNEDPAPALALIRRQLVEAPRRERLLGGSSELADRVRAGLAPSVRPTFDEAVRLARLANFAWWNEEHNVVIDLRAHLPVRRAALAAGGVLGLPRRDDAFYLHVEELLDLLAGRTDPRNRQELADAAQARRAYVERWRGQRAGLPVGLGSGPAPSDPVLREILGSGYPEQSLGAAGEALTGLGVSPGVGRGSARVLATLGELAEVQAGEVLVCEATSPGWTPVFDRIAGCVCDQGGMLTHAAIIAREYGVPAVCGVAGASTSIRTGDLVEVDGTAGLVRVIARRAPGVTHAR